MDWLVGIDEAGRGPLAGPVSVGVVAVPVGFDWCLLSKVGDSKKVPVISREEVYRQANLLKKQDLIKFKVVQISSNIIDKKGITTAIKLAIEKGLNDLCIEDNKCEVRLDGSLKAPPNYLQQVTIIKGDASEPVIGLASILAKVTRDRHMLKMNLKYPEYGFDQHKGYGTKKHRENIKKYGLSVIHRQSFCRNLLKNK